MKLKAFELILLVEKRKEKHKVTLLCSTTPSFMNETEVTAWSESRTVKHDLISNSLSVPQ